MGARLKGDIDFRDFHKSGAEKPLPFPCIPCLNGGMSETLNIIRHIPRGFLETGPEKITDIISRPTIIHLKGEISPPLFVSLLLHGNEVSGWIILQTLLKKYQNKTLPRDLTAFVGNPRACARGLRLLKGQPDFNRIWKGGDLKEHHIAKSVLQYAREHKILYAVDIHNNTGENPLYGCISRKGEEFVRLARGFSENIVYFTQPDSVLSLNISETAPAVVIECGPPGDPEGVKAGVKFIESLLNKKEEWKKTPLGTPHIYSTLARLQVDGKTPVSFVPPSRLEEAFPGKAKSAGEGEPQGALLITDRLDRFNFRRVPAGAVWGQICGRKRSVKLIDGAGRDIFDRFFSLEGKSWTVKTPFIPSMLTKNIPIAKADCLGYVMKKTSVKDFLSDSER